MDIVATLGAAMKAISDAAQAKNADDEAKALADLDSAIAAVAPQIDAFKDAIAKNRAEAERLLAEKFPPVATP